MSQMLILIMAISDFSKTFYDSQFGSKNNVVMTLKLKGLSDKTTLVLSNTRELDRVPNTK